MTTSFSIVIQYKLANFPVSLVKGSQYVSDHLQIF